MWHMWHITLQPTDLSIALYSKSKLHRISSVSKYCLSAFFWLYVNRCQQTNINSLKNYLWAWEKNDRIVWRKAALMNLWWQIDSKRLCGLVSCILVQPHPSLVPLSHLGHSCLSGTWSRRKTWRGHHHHGGTVESVQWLTTACFWLHHNSGAAECVWLSDWVSDEVTPLGRWVLEFSH